MVYFVLAIIGLALGSFTNALVWRIHEQERVKEESPQKHAAYLKELSIVKGRSMCPHCHHQLAAKDLIPLFSWLLLGGKCRYCHKSIGWQYPAVELVVPVLFLASYVFWPLNLHGAGLVEFILWLVFIVGFVALAVYDLRWYLLPNRIVYPLIVLAIAQTLVISVFFSGGWTSLFGAFWGLVIGGGIFYVLFQVSGGKWIGGGDVKLGALIGILMGGPVYSLFWIFSGSLTGTIVSVPLLATGKVKRNSVVPFGPFLLFAAIFVRLFGASIITYLERRSILP